MEVISQCSHLVSPEWKNFAISILIVFGILFSYAPQHYRIITLKSSFGISPYFVLLGTTSSSSAVANVVSQRQSLQDMLCCPKVSGFACFAGILGIFQMAMQCLSFFIILFLFVLYFPRDPITETTPEPSSPLTNNDENNNTTTTTTTTTTTKPATPSITTSNTPTYATALTVAGICIVHVIAILVITLTIGLKQPSSLQHWSDFCGILAAILSSIQYFPQIYYTLRLRCVGSLSIPMMCIQTPGSLVWAGSLAARLGARGWSTWGVLIVTACLQGTLLVLGVFFEYLGPNKGHKHDYEHEHEHEGERGGGEERPSEETPLLQN